MFFEFDGALPVMANLTAHLQELVSCKTKVQNMPSPRNAAFAVFNSCLSVRTEQSEDLAKRLTRIVYITDPSALQIKGLEISETYKSRQS